MSTTINALTAHVVIDSHESRQQAEKVKQELKQALEHLNIQHATLEIESDDASYADQQRCWSPAGIIHRFVSSSDLMLNYLIPVFLY